MYTVCLAWNLPKNLSVFFHPFFLLSQIFPESILKAIYVNYVHMLSLSLWNVNVNSERSRANALCICLTLYLVEFTYIRAYLCVHGWYQEKK